MLKFNTAVAALSLALTFALAGCQSGGATAELPPLDPADAHAEVEVNGMSCPQCSFNISLLMRDVEEIDQTRVDLGGGRVLMTFHEGRSLTADQITDLVDRAGFTPGEVIFHNGGAN